MKKSIAATLIAAAAMAASGSAAFAGKLEEVQTRGKIVVGTGSTNAPWHYIDEKGELKGFDVAISKIIAKSLFNDETKVEFVDQSADARIANLVTDKVDITCQFITVTPQRALQVEFTAPYYREGVGLLVSPKSKYKTLEELKAAGSSVTVSMLQNVFAEEFTHKALPEASVDQYESQDLVAQAVNSGRVDAAVIDASNIRWLVKQDPAKYIDIGYYWQPMTYSCAVKKGDQEWLNWLNTALQEAMAGVNFDDYAKAYNEYFGIELAPPAIGVPVEFR